MRSRLFPLLALAGMLAIPPVPGQNPPEQRVVPITDGGTSGRMESIFIPPKAGAPFTLTLATEWSRPMNNGGTFTLVNERHIARDSKGRIYEERWILVPKGSNIKSTMDVRQIADPEQHTLYNCFTAIKECRILNFSLTTTDNFQPPLGASGPLPNGNGFRTHEDLGLSSAVGIDTHGYRDTITVNPGAMGNDRAMVTMREFWYSAQLGFNLLSIVDDPQSGRQVFTVKEINTSEPEPNLFQTPEGFTVVDRRSEKTAQP